jgi:methylenetetrahydrofolate dehydrogenase (NADP+) / methenyltetrahydrofolate cyclohydrolase
MIILDGRKARDFYKARLTERVSKLARKPCLAIVQVGNNPESAVYIGQKKLFGASIGAQVEHVHLGSGISFADLSNVIKGLNERANVNGIIVQLPLPAHLDKLSVINLIDPKKDTDGLTDLNQALLSKGAPHCIPATAKGVATLLDFYSIPISGKSVVVLGRSRLVGSPAADLMRMRGATVSVCHSKTTNPKDIAQTADILIVAIGKPGHVDASYVKKGAVVVDVGLTSVAGKLKGDVDQESVSKIASALTPVPGGVGPMTVLSLFDTLITSADNNADSAQ